MADTQPAPENAYLDDNGRAVVDGQVWDGPDEWRGKRIHPNRGAARYDEYVDRCPVYCFPHGLSVPICELFADAEGCLVGGVGLPLAAVSTWEWQVRALPEEDFIRPLERPARN